MVSSKAHKDNSRFENKKKENGRRKGHPKAQGGGKQE
jgi:hypothetical protein